eukprot:g2013.t1
MTRSLGRTQVNMEDLSKRAAEEAEAKRKVEEEEQRRKEENLKKEEAARREKEAEERRRKEQEERPIGNRAQFQELQRQADEEKAKEVADAAAAAESERKLAEKAEQEAAARKNDVMAWLKKQGFTGVNNPKKSLFSTTYPLHKAAESGNAKIVGGLLEQGANPAQKNSAGKTALEVVMKKKKADSHKEVLALLSSAGDHFSVEPRKAVKRVIILSVISCTYYICAFIARLLLGQYSDPGNPNSPDELWSGCSQLIIELSIPACGTLLFFFCGANLIFVVASGINFLRFVIRMSGGEEACALEAYNSSQQRDCELLHSNAPLRFLFLSSLLALTWFSCLSFGAGKGLYQGLAPVENHPFSSVPVVGEVIATPEVETPSGATNGTGLRWLFLAFLAQRWTQWAFLAPGAMCQFSGRRALLGSVGASWSLAALEAHAEEDVELELKVLRTGKTPYAKMDYQVFREGKCQEAQIGDLVRVKHRAWFDDFEEGMPWELTLVARRGDDDMAATVPEPTSVGRLLYQYENTE